MHEQDLAIVKALVPVAWADGVFEQREADMLEALLDAYRATPEEKKLVREYASQPRTVADIEVQDLSAADRRVLMQHAAMLAFAAGREGAAEGGVGGAAEGGGGAAAGREGAAEAAVLMALAERLRLPADERAVLIDAARARARRLRETGDRSG